MSKPKILVVSFLGLLVIAGAYFVSKKYDIDLFRSKAVDTLKFSSSFPHYTDPVTGDIVYQISNEPGENYVFYYHQYYYSDPDSVIIVNLPPNDWRLKFYKINLRSGEKTILSDKIANGEFIRGNDFYGYNFANVSNYFGRQNISTKTWENLYSIPSGWAGTGSITVNSNQTHAIFAIAEQSNLSHVKIFLINLGTKNLMLLREEPTADGEQHNHYQFSPSNPDIFAFVNQKPPFGLSRMRIGSVSSKRLEPIEIEANQGDYFSSTIFGDANMAHQIWNADGRLCSDVLWHQQNPSGMYGFVCFALGVDPFVPIPKMSQNLRFIPNTSWSNHYKDTSKVNWFVGDGDLLKNSDQVTQSKFTNILHLTSVSDNAVKYKTEVYNLAEIKGVGDNFANAHMVANNDGAITTWNYSLSGNSTRNVFLIQVPDGVTNMLNGTMQTVAPTPSPSISPTPTPLPTLSPTPSPSPTKLPSPTPTPTRTPTPLPSSSPKPISYLGPPISSYGLKEGDTLSASNSSDPDIYIINDSGYKRLFLNPIIFSFYGHLGGYQNVRTISASTRDLFPTSGLFRNCEINDPKVYGVEVTGEDTGTLHWVNTSGTQATQDDPNFFQKVFCINNNEFNWYAKGSAYTSVKQVVRYGR